jgi:hypothetical protein
MCRKSESFSKFKIFKNLVKFSTKSKVQVLKIDKGGDFTSHEFNTFYENKHGIKRNSLLLTFHIKMVLQRRKIEQFWIELNS